MSDETVIDQTAAKSKPQPQKVVNQHVGGKQENMPISAKPKENNAKKTIGVAGVAGAVGVVAGLLTPIQVFPQNSEITDEDLETDAYQPSDSDLEVATSVDDSMTFNEAFAAARHEVGAGGIFTWHGHTYSTFYKEEWDAMSPEDREEYWADVNETTSHLNDESNVAANDNHEPSDTGEAEVIGISDDEIDPNDDIPTEPAEGWDDETDPAVIANIEPLDPEEIIDPGEEPIYALDPDEQNILSEPCEDPAFETGVEENPDFDMLASNFNNSDIPIDNNMDMSDFA